MFSKQKKSTKVDLGHLNGAQRNALHLQALQRIEELAKEIKNCKDDPYGLKLVRLSEEQDQQMELATKISALNSKEAGASLLKEVKGILKNPSECPELYELYTKDPSFAGDLKAAGFSNSVSAQPKR